MPPDQPGTYVLFLRLPHPTSVQVGRLGRFQFPTGWHAYVGSGRGPGGLAARVSRHLRSPKPLRWHVDYVRDHAQPASVWYATGSQKRECEWAQALSRFKGASIPAARFGASDCRCPAHLIHFVTPPDLAPFARAVDEPVSEERLNV